MLRKTQFPPTRSDFSKQSKAIPRCASALTAAIPEEPAPITQTESDTGVRLGFRISALASSGYERRYSAGIVRLR